MASNHKLSAVLKGRAIKTVQTTGTMTTVRFDDGSAMTVKTDGSTPEGAKTGRVRAVRQRDTTLDLDLEGGTTVEFRTAEPTASVMVRDRKGTLEYAD